MRKQEPGDKACLLVLASTYPRWQDDPEPGFVHELSRRLTDRFRVIVLCPHAPGTRSREMLDGVEIVRYRYAPERWETLVNDGGIVTNLKLHRWKLLLVPGFILMQTWRAWRLCRQEKVDVVHAHWLIPQGTIAALLHYLPGHKVPFTVTSHGADLFSLRQGWLQALKRWVLTKASSATVVSTAMLDAVSATGIDTSKVHVLPMGVDMQNRFVPDAALPRKSDELLFVGRLVEKKGLRHLLDALPLVLTERPTVHLNIAGFGPEELMLKAQAAALGISHAVHFLGPIKQDDLPALYQRAALFIAPFVTAGSGDQEGLGLVVVEAIACGCPVLVGDVTAVRDVLGENGEKCITDARNRDLLAWSVLCTLAQPEQAQNLARQLRQNLLGRLDWSAIGHAYADLLAITAYQI